MSSSLMQCPMHRYCKEKGYLAIPGTTCAAGEPHHQDGVCRVIGKMRISDTVYMNCPNCVGVDLANSRKYLVICEAYTTCKKECQHKLVHEHACERCDAKCTQEGGVFGSVCVSMADVFTKTMEADLNQPQIDVPAVTISAPSLAVIVKEIRGYAETDGFGTSQILLDLAQAIENAANIQYWPCPHMSSPAPGDWRFKADGMGTDIKVDDSVTACPVCGSSRR